MGSTTVAGHRIVECRVTDDMRQMVGDETAFEAALDRLRAEYYSFVEYGHAEPGKGVTFVVVLTAQRSGKPR